LLASNNSPFLDLWLSCHTGEDSSDAFKRRILSRYCGLAPDEIVFTYGPQGKPSVVNSLKPCAFSVSHSGDWILCGVSGGAPVGVDIECMDRQRDTMRLAQRFYTAGEFSALESLPSEERSDHFYDLWTLKESAVKARGEALASGLAKWGFGLCRKTEVDRIEAFMNSGESDEPHAHYYLIETVQNYRAGICWLGSESSLPRLKLFTETEDDIWHESVPPLRAVSN
jgi:phosphopantetheine--protein transferase-like protein